MSEPTRNVGCDSPCRGFTELQAEVAALKQAVAALSKTTEEENASGSARFGGCSTLHAWAGESHEAEP